MLLSCEDAYAPSWGSRGRRFKSGRPDAGQRLFRSSGTGHLGSGGNDAVPTQDLLAGGKSGLDATVGCVSGTLIT
jgi:hypothetical protein